MVVQVDIVHIGPKEGFVVVGDTLVEGDSIVDLLSYIEGVDLEDIEGVDLEDIEGVDLEDIEGADLKEREPADLDNIEAVDLEDIEGVDLEDIEAECFRIYDNLHQSWFEFCFFKKFISFEAIIRFFQKRL